MSRPGVFVVSLDTELAWGCFDVGGLESLRPAYENTRAVIDSILDLFDQYRIPATWALVAHLLDDCNGEHTQSSPAFDWVDWFSAVPCRTGVDRRLWYAPDVYDAITDATVDHDIGLHGYSHMILGAEGCSRADAATELATAIDTFRRVGQNPDSFVFPRNQIGYVDLLAQHGIETYRGLDQRWYETAPIPDGLAKPFRFLDEATVSTPSTGTPRERSGIVEIPGSQVFRPYHGGWQYTPEHSQRQRALKGLERAATTGDVFHLWFHPFNLAQERTRLLAELESVLQYASQLREQGQLEVLTMAEVAVAFRDGRWEGAV